MSFAPPPGPPPPPVPEGWTAQLDERYHRWFFVNLHTSKSQWELPTEPARPEKEAQYAPPTEPPPPSYESSSGNYYDAGAGDIKRPLSSNNPYNASRQIGTATSTSTPPSIDEDARLAARLQAEENARASGGGAGSRSPLSTRLGGSAAEFYDAPQSQSHAGPYSSHGPPPPLPRRSPMPQSPPPPMRSPMPGSPPPSKSKGFLGKLMGKASGSGSSNAGYAPASPQYGYQGGYQYPQGGYGGGGYPGYPPPQPAYGYRPPQGGYYPMQQQQAPHRSGGMGPGAAAALGAGGGLLGGALLADAFEDHDDHDSYDDGYDAGYNDADDGGYDDF